MPSKSLRDTPLASIREFFPVLLNGRVRDEMPE